MRLGYELRPYAPPLWPPMSTLRRFLRLPAMLLLVGGLVLLSACDDSVTDPPVLEEEEDPDEVVITDDAVVVSPETTPIQRVAGDTLVFQVSGSSPKFEPGNVVVGEEGEGFLRRVVSVDVTEDQAVLVTEEASLVDVVERGTLRENFALEGAMRSGLEWQLIEAREGVTADAGTLGLELKDVDLPVTTGLSVTFTNGDVSFNPDIDFQLRIRRSSLQELRVAASGRLDFNVDVEVAASQKISTSDSTRLARFQGQPITFLIGIVPVVILPTLDFIAGYEVGLEQEGSITSGLESENSLTAGAEYTSGNWTPILDRSNTLEARPFVWDQSVSAGAKGYIRPELSFEVYGVAGPFINSNAYLRAQAGVTATAWEWGVYSGVDGSFGGKVEIFDNVVASYSHTFARVEWDLASDSGEFGDEEVQATISGEVIDAETGSGVEVAEIVGTDTSTGADLFETSTDGFGDYEITFSVEEALDEIDVAVRADDYEEATSTIAFEEEMVLDVQLRPTDDAQGGEATISGQIVDNDTGTGIGGATVSGLNAETGEELFVITTTNSGVFETAYAVDNEPSEIQIAAQADGYVSAEETIPFEADIEDLVLYLSVQGDVTEGLVAYYPFNGNANDETGNGYDAVVRGAQLTEDRFGQADRAYDFDGNNAYIDIPNNAAPVDQGSISLWFNARSADKWDRLFSMSRFGSPPGTRLYIQLGEGETVGVHFLSTQMGYTGIPFNEWNHVIFTWNDEAAKFYVNGGLVEEIDGGRPTNGRVTLGSYGEGFKHFYDGLLDDVRIYNRVLSSDEVANVYGE